MDKAKRASSPNDPRTVSALPRLFRLRGRVANPLSRQVCYSIRALLLYLGPLEAGFTLRAKKLHPLFEIITAIVRKTHSIMKQAVAIVVVLLGDPYDAVCELPSLVSSRVPTLSEMLMEPAIRSAPRSPHCHSA